MFLRLERPSAILWLALANLERRAHERLCPGPRAHFNRQAAQYDQNTSVYYSGPAKCSGEDAAALEDRADVLVSLGNACDNQLPSKLFGYFATGKPVLHLAVSKADPALPYLARYPLALVLHAEDGVPSAAASALGRWLHEVCGRRLPFAEVAALYPEFTPEYVANEFLRWI